jgi:nucleotide-binding universal stress UspA family protein
VKVVFWLVEGTWEGLVAATREVVPAEAEISLLHVTPADVGQLPGEAAGALLGRMPHGRAHGYEEAADEAASQIFAAAARTLARDDAELVNRHGRPEREVVAAAAGADLLVVARDGDRSRLGPHSLGHATRFVVDHAPCSVLLVWPEEPPGVESIPPPKPGHGPPPAPHGPKPEKHRPRWL